MPHPALSPGAVAVVTGGASGIGLAAAVRFARMGLRVCIADLGEDRLARAADALAAASPHGAAGAMAVAADVTQADEVRRLEAAVRQRFGGTDVLMNNAGVQPGSGVFGPAANWHRVLGVNLWGVVNGVQAFVPGMVERGRPGLVVNTGSKQGITCPPGDTAYNVTKAGVKVVTEALAHELRNVEGCQVTAHLLIPGFTFTGFTRAKGVTEKPADAWTAEQVVDFMLDAMANGDFYILCPDNDVSRETDNKRIRWAAEDIIQNRPPLSRWHPDYREAFDHFEP